MLTQDYLRECFSYKPDTGVLYWKARPRNHFPTDRVWKMFNSRFAGTAAGSLGISNGYLRVRISGKNYRVHRTIWCPVTGAFPEHQIDHENHVRSDNRWCNLREATNQDNGKNKSRNKNNTSGCAGACWNERAQKWRAYICVGGRRKYLGYFDTLEEAVAARKVAEVRHNFHPGHGSSKPQQPRVTPRIAP